MLWESISEGKAKAEGLPSVHCAFARPRLPYTAEKGTDTATGQGVCHGNAMVYHSELWDFIGVAMKGLSELLG